MEELQVIETTSGRQFKPWASREDVQVIKQETVQAVVQAVQDPASVTAITSEIAGGKQAIASAINAKGGTASATESFTELAEAVEEIPNNNFEGIVFSSGFNPRNTLEVITNLNEITEIDDDITEDIDGQYGGFPNVVRLNFLKLKRITGSLVNMPIANIDFPEVEYYKATYSNVSLGSTLYLPKAHTVGIGVFFSHVMSSVLHFKFPLCSTLIPVGESWRGADPIDIEFGQLNSMPTNMAWMSLVSCQTIKVAPNTDGNQYWQYWKATTAISAIGVQQLNDNLYNDMLVNLYDHSQDGQTRTLRIGWLANVTAENIAYANAKGWTLTT